MLTTTSQLISHHKAIEEQQSCLYSVLAGEHPEHSDVFMKLGKDSLKHLEMVQRAYREGVTDAFEVGFLAKPINENEYVLIKPMGGLADAVKVMLSNDKTIIRFCEEAAVNSGNLLPDVPETFMRLVKRKKKNLDTLKEMGG
ncbi:hypothetical protein E2P71_09295 [Candidatus Bathyarchaeota archaeon]|nr:hypothetical protein E2P71_09295 [Candidatus Bathyarchaeota archaeon]